jgi:hypothetical protein
VAGGSGAAHFAGHHGEACKAAARRGVEAVNKLTNAMMAAGDLMAEELDKAEEENRQLRVRLNAIIAQVKGVADSMIEHAHIARRRAEYTSEVNLNGNARRLRAIVAPEQSSEEPAG